ncbi:MAG: sodium:proton antiporter [Acidobacteria bacterium]|nr:sodium:proton antiporter [Acidobacteriota bacterium]
MIRLLLAGAGVLLTAGACPAATSGAAGAEANLGAVIPLWLGIPFAGILLSIALFPVLAPRFWHHRYPWVSAAWGLAAVVPFVALHAGRAVNELLHIVLVDYIPFIILLWGLFTVSGGIALRGRLVGTPGLNLLFMASGTVLASFMGTTGAAMLLIRPLLKANRNRRHKVHTVVFFIFLTANVGGCLTPLGDPPLFLGFLHHVPFFWTLKLMPVFLFTAGVLLAVYALIETRLYRQDRRGMLRKEAEAPDPHRLSVDGKRNFLFLGGILGAVLMSGMWAGPGFHLLGIPLSLQNLARDGLIVLMGGLSLGFTRRETRDYNEFGWGPIREVAILFAGIFVTIAPVIAILKAGEAGPLAALVRSVREPWQYFWAVGGLSSFLDNAPTYYTFFNMALGRFFPGSPEFEAVRGLIGHHPLWLEAISAGAVFMGANTYIGNAPNFMVRSIAEEAGVAMPSFFGYLFRWSLPILIPTFLVVGWLFF